MTVTLSDLRKRPKHVTRLARRRRGVDVVDEHGVVVFRLCIPSTELK